MLVLFVVFVLMNIPFAVLDLTGFPAFLLKYKIQDDKKVPVRQLQFFQPLLPLTSFLPSPLLSSLLHFFSSPSSFVILLPLSHSSSSSSCYWLSHLLPTHSCSTAAD